MFKNRETGRSMSKPGVGRSVDIHIKLYDDDEVSMEHTETNLQKQKLYCFYWCISKRILLQLVYLNSAEVKQ